MKRTYLICPISAELTEKSHALFSEVRKNPKNGIHGKALADVITDLSEEAMGAYFLSPISMMTNSRFGLKIASSGIKTGLKLVHGISNQILKKLPEKELIQLTHYMESLLQEIPLEDE